MPFRLIEAPEVEPLSAADLRTRLNLPATTSTASLDALEKAARQNIERQYGLAFITQTLEYVSNHFPGYYNLNNMESGFGDDVLADLRPPPAGNTDIIIPYTPVKRIVGLTYYDPDGVWQTMDEDDYVFTPGNLTSRIALINNGVWPNTYYGTESVVVRFEAGFADSGEELDEIFKMAIVLMAAHLRSLTSMNLFLSSDSVVGVGQKSYVVGEGPAKVINNAVSMLLQSYIRLNL